MYRTIKISLLWVFLTGLSSHVQASEHTLALTISNLKQKHGKILVALYKKTGDSTQWPKKPFKTTSIVVTKAQNTLARFELPKGLYGIKVLHDLNQNKMNDIDEQGMPTEAFAFSRTAANTDIIPSFNDSLINLNQSMQLELSLLHPGKAGAQ